MDSMAYLVRRLLENTANESFLRQSFAEGAEMERLLENPEETYKRELAAKKNPAARRTGPGGYPVFANEATVDFTMRKQSKPYDYSDPRPPSRSQKKRDSAAAQVLGGKVAELPESALKRLDLPPDLALAIGDYKAMQSNSLFAPDINFANISPWRTMRYLPKRSSLRQSPESMSSYSGHSGGTTGMDIIAH